ncbi:hypothetical protein B296_00035670 [Ensete ventricosum]|uniref:Uncharacterized protein n=1 Tax=Ensete ventricosum TaxID=4639 RepID=A0A426XT03_ENSVE|nr:hypothetical protein B296_00035670 [Ensete ventricosum]
MSLLPSVELSSSRLPPQVDDDHADIVLAPPRECQLRQQRRGVGASAVATVAGYPRGCTGPQAHASDVAGHVVGDHVPQPVAPQDEALVLLAPLRHRHLRFRCHVRLQVAVPCCHDTEAIDRSGDWWRRPVDGGEGRNDGRRLLTDGSGHGEHTENPCALPVDDSTAGRLDPTQLVRPVRLQDPHGKEGSSSIANAEQVKRIHLNREVSSSWEYLVIEGEGDGDAAAAEDGTGVAAVGDDNAGRSHDGDDGGGAHVVAPWRLKLAAAAGDQPDVARLRRRRRRLRVHQREAPLHQPRPCLRRQGIRSES